MSRSIDSINTTLTAAGQKQQLRLVVQALLKATLANNPDVLGLYSVWLPDAVDGQDESYEQGRFASYWTRDDSGEIFSQQLTEADIENSQLDDRGIRDNEWFLCAIETGKACVLEPYENTININGKADSTWMSTLLVPLKVSGKVAGVVGIDFNLDYFKRFIGDANRELFEGHGELQVISNQGKVIASASPSTSKSASNSGEQALPSQVQTSLQKALKTRLPQRGSSTLYNNRNNESNNDSANELWFFIEPFSVISGSDSWAMIYSIPGSAVTLEQQQLDTRIEQAFLKSTHRFWWIIIAVVVIFITLLMVSARRMMQLIDQTRDIIKQASAGHFKTMTNQRKSKLDDDSREMVSELERLFSRSESLEQELQQHQKQLAELQQSKDDSSSHSLQRLQQQQQALQQVDSVLDTMVKRTSAVSDTIYASAQSAEQAQQSARDSVEVFSQSNKHIELLTDDITRIVEVVEKLNTHSDSIIEIVNVIRGIADQTNLLALNAADSAQTQLNLLLDAIENIYQLAQKMTETLELQGNSRTEVREQLDTVKALSRETESILRPLKQDK